MIRLSRIALLVTFSILLVGAVGVGVVGQLLPSEAVRALTRIDFFVLALAVALGDRLVLPRKVGRSTALSVAVIASLAMLLQEPATVVALSVAAWLTQAIRASRRRRSVRISALLSGSVVAWAMAGVAVLVAQVDELFWMVEGSSVPVAPVVAIWGLLLFAAPGVEALEVALRAEQGRRLRYRDLVLGGIQANTVIAATATLGALAFPVLGAPTVLLMALPLLAAKLGFDRDAETRTNYDQTLRAMSRLPEKLGAVDPGHGIRAGEVAATAAIELGYGVEFVADIERAAQLHELGRIRTEHGLGLTPTEVAESGAEVLRKTGDLDRVADLIAAHRGPVSVGDELAWVGGAIVRLACDLDLRLTTRGERALEPADQSWIRSQGVQPRIAEAIIRAAQLHYAPVPA